MAKTTFDTEALDAFEWLTAMYAAQGRKRRDDWPGDKAAEEGDDIPAAMAHDGGLELIEED